MRTNCQGLGTWGFAKPKVIFAKSVAQLGIAAGPCPPSASSVASPPDILLRDLLVMLSFEET